MNITSQYTDEYYKDQIAPSLESARIFLGHLWKYYQPQSVVDVGCGRGAWLKACHELGSSELFGLDGDWNNQAAMIDDHIRFRAIDLNRPFTLDGRVELAMSVEVAEHLEPASSAAFVESLTRAADAVVFGAAYLRQNGPTHINERRHSWWAHLFQKNGYVPFDLFRPSLWGDEQIPFWYRQNTFLYARKNSPVYATLKAAGFAELLDLRFLDCIHPVLFELRTSFDLGFRDHLGMLVPSLLRAMRKKRQNRH
ncbi:MAG: class I SAM-dependent methyltransferase [Acidobacteriota bacterium]